MIAYPPAVPALVLGPMLRYVGEREAVIWVETDGPCEVDVLGHRERTFHVEGHHYALVRVEGLEPGEWIEYDVSLDGEKAWPEPDSEFPPSVIRTYPRGEPVKLVFGSCRVTVPHHPPYTLPKDEDEAGREIDALYALTRRMRREPRESWPHLLLLLGDQVYADEVSPQTLEYIEATRGTSKPPYDRIANFEEYTRLYREAWSEPTIRWLLSTVSTAMIFDDHDVHDDWNISRAWLERVRSWDWWDEHIVGGLMAYWLYQHLGNIGPDAQEQDELLREVQAAADAGPILRSFAYRADRETDGSRWSFCRDIGGTRLVVVDSRAGRVLDEDRRSMVDDEEWDWIVEHATGGYDHLLIATSVPFLLLPAMHYLEAWNERVCGGAWGRVAAKAGEWIREAVDLEHWAAFEDSFGRLAELQRSVGAGERGPAPASIVTLSGDVHHAYLQEVAFRRDAEVRSAVYQAVCSPFRNALDSHERAAIRFAASPVGSMIGHLLARSSGAVEYALRWRLVGDGPWFDNQVATLEIEGRQIRMRLERAVNGRREEPRLEQIFERQLA